MRIENYLGFPTGITGAELMGRALLQAQKFGAEFSTPSAATEQDVGGPFPVVRIEGGERVEARCVLIATGGRLQQARRPRSRALRGAGHLLRRNAYGAGLVPRRRGRRRRRR
jgi:thioredoxin reductase (NADPH)